MEPGGGVEHPLLRNLWRMDALAYPSLSGVSGEFGHDPLRGQIQRAVSVSAASSNSRCASLSNFSVSADVANAAPVVRGQTDGGITE
jgi:hypothetical protein